MYYIVEFNWMQAIRPQEKLVIIMGLMNFHRHQN